MRPRRSLAGPLILIAIGIVFLIRVISPGFSVLGIFSAYWPYLLIAWGAIELIELSIRFLAGSSAPLRTISGGGWFMVVLICCAGLLAHAAWESHGWWHGFGWQESVRMFGNQHTYPIPPVQKHVGPSPHVIVESFRGDAKITGDGGDTVSLAGHKSIRSFSSDRADAANAATPVAIALEGNTVIVRCNQDRAEAGTPVSTDLELSLPKGASLEAAGAHGDFDISALAGGVALTTRGGSHIELDGVSGPVTIDSRYPGSILLRHVSQHVHVASFHTEFDAQKIPGEVVLEGGTLRAEGMAGPVKLTAHATDVSLDGFTGPIEVSVDSGDIALTPRHLPLSAMTVSTHAGNIDLALPPAATFALTAFAHRGEVQNRFSPALQETDQGSSTRLEGSIGTGPQVNLVTGSGNVILRKTSVAPAGNPAVREKTVQYSR